MASRSAFRAFSPISTSLRATRSFQTSTRRMAEAATPLPPKRPVGAFRGGLVGFALGSIIAGGGVYYYVLEEYKVSNELLTEDIYSLQAAVQRTYAHVGRLEDKLESLVKSKKS